MSLSPGTRLGAYEIVAPLGAGGMGAVYQARDTKLGRAVAIKVILDEFASNAERVGRFEREAKMLASLHHHRIASLFGMEHADGQHFLVMELVEGETLAEQLRRASMPVEEAVPVAIQIAEALEAAHEKGVVHRDLKPANVKITREGHVKVLDFGLAKVIENESTAGSAANSPTLSMMATQAGLILGTAAYMSPEQAKGLPADHRSDIFSFGIVLYEMLTGRTPFQGETGPDILASVLVREPDLSALPQDLNPRLVELIRRCLAKNPKKRWQAIGDVGAELEALATSPRTTTTAASAVPRSWWRRALPAVLTGIFAALTAGSAVWVLKPAPVQRVVQLSLPLAAGQVFTGPARQMLEISPDGQRIVYAADNQLHVRTLSETAGSVVAGLSDVGFGITPTFSDDGQSIAFHAPGDQTIKTIALSGATPVTVGPASNPLGISWSGDNIFVGQGTDGILRMSVSTGRRDTAVKVAGHEQAYGPRMLPDGENLLFTIATGQGSDRWDHSQIVVQSLRSGIRKVLVTGGSDARYLPSGHLIYANAGSLFAVRFDPRQLEVRGSPVTVLRGVRRVPTGITGAAQFAFATNGTLAYIAGPVSGPGESYGIAIFDRSGNPLALKVPPGSYEAPRVSRDGKRIAFGGVEGGDPVVFTYDLAATTSMERVTFTGKSRLPVWCGAERIIFQSDREKDLAIFSQSLSGTRRADRVTRPETGLEHLPDDCSPDGKTLLFTAVKGSMYSLQALTFEDGKIVPIVTGSSVPSGARFSHDGRWIAYCTREGAVTTIFVEPFPQTGARYQLPRRGRSEPHHPLWMPGDGELRYVPGPGGFEGVSVQRENTVAFGEVVALPRKFYGMPPLLQSSYDILPDGRMLALTYSETGLTGTPEIRVILNWFEQLKGTLPK